MIVEITAEAARNPRIAAMTLAIDADVRRGLADSSRRPRPRARPPPRSTPNSPRASSSPWSVGLVQAPRARAGFQREAEAAMTMGVLKALFAGAIAPFADPKEPR